MGVPIWTPDKYPSLAATMPVARYAEAQLIVAESKLAANDIPGAVTAINAVRATRAGVPAYDATGQTAAQVLTQIIEERRRELFLEGHRLGDLRRYNLPFSRQRARRSCPAARTARRPASRCRTWSASTTRTSETRSSHSERGVIPSGAAIRRVVEESRLCWIEVPLQDTNRDSSTRFARSE